MTETEEILHFQTRLQSVSVKAFFFFFLSKAGVHSKFELHDRIDFLMIKLELYFLNPDYFIKIAHVPVRRQYHNVDKRILADQVHLW